jgi:outer membrane autotransporter protein
LNANGGTFDVAPTTTLTMTDTIGGAGALTKADIGTLVLTGTNIYLGGTTVASGVLQLGDGGTTGSILGDVTDNGALAFDRSDLLTFSGAISGGGAVTQIGSGTTILTGASTYLGGTAIQAGTLQLGNGGMTGSIVGDVIDNGALAFDRGDAVTFAGTISGTGSVKQIGPGSTTLTAANTYSGGTLLSAGTLIAGDNNALGSGALTVAANPAGTSLDSTPAATTLANPIVLNPSANLAVAGSNPLTLAGEISGDGALTKNGASTLILTADNSYAGGTTINTGTLQVGDGGATGGLGTGPVLDDAALVFNRSGIVTVPGAITGTGSLTQLGVVGGTLVLTGANAYSGGTTIASGILQLGDGGSTGSIVGDVTDSGTLAFDRSDTMTFPGVISGSGAVAQIGSGTTILTADNPYAGGTTVSAGTLAVGDFAHPSAALSGGGPIAIGAGGTLGGYGSITGAVTNGGVIAPGSATPGFSGSPTGTFTIIGNLFNQGAIQLASGESIGNVLEVHGNYVGSGGSMAINTFLGGDGSPSDRLVINGGAATGSTSVHVTNVGGPGALTTANGIQVVSAASGATTSPAAFTLSNGELRGGAFDYDLFRGGVSGNPNDWFLRSDFMSGGGGGGGVLPPQPPILPPTPPPDLLPPGVAFPIIGPELATYGVVQPLARQLGLSILGTLDDRMGDTYEPDGCAVQPAVAPDSLPTRKGRAPGACPLFSPSAWGRFFGQTIHNNYQAFAAPSASGDLGGFQGGIDLLRGPVIPGGYDRAGLYGAYGDVHADVNGLVTNPAATAYVLNHTGSMNLNSWSAGGYWTHVGPGGWYLDAVLQGTWYYGSASTQFAKLNTDGTGFIASLEGGYPFSWPQLGPGFVIEPQGQILWQKVSFRHDYDGLGDVALGDTTGPSGRIGLRTKWTVVTGGGQVWQPYLRANLWRDWGAEADAVYSGTDIVPLLNQVTMLELGGGLTGRINANISVFANVDYEFAVGAAENEKRNGVRGAFGARYTW